MLYVRYRGANPLGGTKLFRESLGTRDMEEARQLVQKSRIRELELAARADSLTAETVARLTIGEVVDVETALDRWKAWMLGTGSVRELTALKTHETARAWARNSDLLRTPVTQISADTINKTVNTGDNKRSTRQRLLSILRSFFAFCKETGLTLNDPTAIVRVATEHLTHRMQERRFVRLFSEEDVEKIKTDASVPIFWRTAVWLAWETGMRLRDIIRLEWASVDQGRLTVWTSKTNKRLVLEIPEELLIPFCHSTDFTHVFPDYVRRLDNPSQMARLSQEFSRICDRLDIPGGTFHGLRHSYITRLSTEGVDISEIAEKVGHSNTATTAGYIHA